MRQARARRGHGRTARPGPFALYAVVAFVAATAACSSEAVDVSVVVVELQHFASSTATLSANDDIALVSSEVACVVDSYDSRIHCVDRSDRSVGVFGVEGEGPGEFRGLTGIERGPDGLLAAIEFSPSQLTLFEPDGTFVSEVRLPPLFQGNLLHGDRLFGMKLALLDWDRAENVPDYVPMEAAISAREEVLWERSDLAEAAGRDCLNGAMGIPTPHGGLVFEACGHELAFFDEREADGATVVASPAYVEALPNERDVDAYLDEVTSIGLARVGGLSPEQREAYAAEFRQEPKGWFLKPNMFKFDAEGRLWVATTRDRDAFSYFDVWVGTEYAGSVQIRDRLMGYDIQNSTLVALVERTPDRNGIAQQAIDWYDIEPVEFGRDER